MENFHFRINDYFHLDWNQNMIRQLTLFIEDYLLQEKLTVKLAETIRKKINRELEGRNVHTSRYVSSDVIIYPNVPRNIFDEDLTWMDIDELEIARQLTLIDYEIYASIKVFITKFG